MSGIPLGRFWLACLIPCLFVFRPLAAGEPARSSLTSLIRDLSSDDWLTRIRAIRALEEVGPKARAAVPSLLRALADPAVGVRAARALQAIDPNNREAVPLLVKRLASRAHETRCHALRVLSEFVHNPRQAVPPVLAGLQDRSEEVRAEAAHALRYIGQGHARVKAALVRALRDPERQVRLKAAYALAWIAPDDRVSVPVLVSAFEQPVMGYLRAIAPVAHDLGEWLLTGRLDTAFQSTLFLCRQEIQAIDKQRGPPCFWASLGLRRLGPTARGAIPALRAACHDQNRRVVLEAMRALDQILSGVRADAEELKKTERQREQREEALLEALDRARKEPRPDPSESFERLRELRRRIDLPSGAPVPRPPRPVGDQRKRTPEAVGCIL
jgi:HEAT repeats